MTDSLTSNSFVAYVLGAPFNPVTVSFSYLGAKRSFVVNQQAARLVSGIYKVVGWLDSRNLHEFKSWQKEAIE